MTELKPNAEQNTPQANGVNPSSQIASTIDASRNPNKRLEKQTSALENIALHLGIAKCNSDHVDNRMFFTTLIVLVLVFLASVAGFFTMWFTTVYDDRLLEQLKLTQHSPAADWWEKPPVNPLLKVHVFNYTNVEDFFDKKTNKLKVVDLGPYVYTETAEKVNVVYNGDGTITYKEKRSYQFLANQSSGMQYDEIVVPNVPMLTAASKYYDRSFFQKTILKTALAGVSAKPFKKLKLNSFLWGYQDELLNLASKLSFDSEVSFEKFGILMTRNGTSPETFTIYTGENDLKQLLVIKELDGKPALDMWSTDECNRVDGTDGSQFPPHLMDKRQTLYVFIKSLCRKFPLRYEKEVTLFDGIPAWRYKAPLDVFAHPSINVDNQCFCHLDSASCPKSGVLNATLCSYEAPIFASFPHFYTGDRELLETVEGLNPQQDKHETFADIHPRLAFPIDGASRFQINVQVKKTISDLEPFDDDHILPVIWIEVVPGHISEELRELIYYSSFGVNNLQFWLKYGSLLICATTFALLAMTCYFRGRKQSNGQLEKGEQQQQYPQEQNMKLNAMNNIAP
ncbi:lysosome membrane protein 2 [Uranotaenia lowii]|uniref:lysosome membrane protein 2 n=1 Tax=Uranotaenia lowii TaxID=190385 RepID=UPI002478ADB7|nr:lysosome membrane protein 2 [Uranotaenia lowii]